MNETNSYPQVAPREIIPKVCVWGHRLLWGGVA